MSLREKLLGRFKAQIASNIVTAVAGGLLTVGLARLLEPNGYGLLFLALSVVSMFKLVARFGIARSTGRYVAQYREEDPAQIPFIVRTGLIINAAAILLACIVLAGSHRYIASLLNEPELSPLILVGVLFVAFGTAVTFLEKVIQGFEAIRFVAFMTAFDRATRLLFALGLVALGVGAIGALWGYVISSFLASIVGFVYLYRRVRSFREGSETIEAGLRRRIAEYAIPITATNTSIVLDKRVDTLLVGFFLSPVAVSYYVLGEQVVRFVIKPMSALSFTISPTFGSQKAAGNISRISRIYEEALMKTLLLYVPASAGLILIADPLIHLMFGSEYSGAVPVLQVLGLYVVLTTVTKISDNGLDYLGRARERAVARGITAVLNVALNIVLIPTMGVVGAAIATVITYTMYTIANLYIAAQEFNLRIGKLARSFGLIAAITAAMSVVVFVLTEYITGWLTLWLVIGVGAGVWGALSLATGLVEVREVRSVLT